MTEENINREVLIDKGLKENVIKKLLQYGKKEIEKDLEDGEKLINNFNQSDVNEYMNNLKFKYGIINSLYMFIKYGPSLNNIDTTNYNFSKEELYEQVCIVNAIKQTLDIKDEVDKYNKLIDLLKTFINNYNNNKNNTN